MCYYPVWPGIVDCVAVLGELVCLVDWKTSEKTKLSLESLYDAPLQVAAYIGRGGGGSNLRHQPI